MQLRVLDDEELEAPTFDGAPFTSGDPTEDRRSRSAGWSLTLVFVLAVVAFYSLRAGSWMGAAVLSSLAAGAFGLSCILIRSELRQYMAYKHRL